MSDVLTIDGLRKVRRMLDNLPRRPVRFPVNPLAYIELFASFIAWETYAVRSSLDIINKDITIT